MEMIKNISIIFMSIFFESLPFLLLGSFISAIIETYISNETICKLIPKNKILGSFAGIFLGLFIPACDCAVIPISKRLIKKGVPINAAVSFMLASPIINPVVLLATYYAFFQSNPKIFYLRIIYGIIIALIIGIILGVIFNDKEVVKESEEDEHCHCHEHCHCNHHKDSGSKIISIFKHTSIDFYEVVKYLMFGALIASIIQIALPRSILTIFNNNQVLSIITLIVFAYLISLCSTSDSFVGKSLLSSFSQGSVLAYLLLGPMIDIKNTIVLFGNYKKSYVITLISLIFIIIFAFSLMVVFL